jgi:hypothetical protein
LAVQADKGGILRLIDVDNMGGFNPGGPDRVLQEFTANPQGLIYSSPVYFDGKIYLQGVGEVLKAYALKLDPATNTMMLDKTPVSQGTIVSGFPGTVESVSADGTSNGIVWSPQVDGFAWDGPAVLRAYNANDLSKPLYASNQAGPRDTAGGGVKFTTPTIANGMVYLGTQFEVDVYGLLRRSAGAGKAQEGNVPQNNLSSDDTGLDTSSTGPWWMANNGSAPAAPQAGAVAQAGYSTAGDLGPQGNVLAGGGLGQIDAFFQAFNAILTSLETSIEAMDPQTIVSFRAANAALGALESGTAGHPIAV